MTDPTTTRPRHESLGGAAPRVLDIEVRAVGKIFRPAAGIRELVRGQLRRPPVAALSVSAPRVRNAAAESARA